MNCGSAVDSIIVAHNGRFFVRGCAQGTAVLTITNQADSSVSASYTVTSPGLAPMFAEDSYARSVYENSPAGTHVGLPIAAEDEDALAYALSGDGATAFAVDANGQITVVVGATIDYETAASYSLTLTATDTTGGTDTATVDIEVLDLREAELLGRVETELGNSGDDYGFNTGYGRLVGGDVSRGTLRRRQLPRHRGHLRRTRTASGTWCTAAGPTDDWNDAQEELDEIMVEVYYEDQRNTRALVLGGFIEERNGNTLKLDPPLPSRDWDGRSGEEVAFRFRRHAGQTAPAQAAAIAPPQASPNSIVRFVSDTTPGGPEVAQNLIVLLVYGAVGLQEEPHHRQPAPGRPHPGADPLGLRDLPDGHAHGRGDQHHEPAPRRLRLQVLLRRPGAVLMTALRKAAILLMVVHIAAAFVELTRSYYNGYLTGYGMDGWLAHTPIGSHFDLEATDSGSHDVGLQGIETVPRIFQFFFELGETVNRLAIVHYDFMSEITTANFLFVLVLGLRIFSIGVWASSAMALATTVFQSNLLASKVGLVMLFGGIGVLSALGIFF